MKTNKLNKLYEGFTIPERINLSMAAFARADKEEQARLFNTCPTVKYIEADYEFVAKHDGLIFLNTMVCSNLETLINKVNLASVSLFILGKQMQVIAETIESLNASGNKIIAKLNKETIRLEKFIQLFNNCLMRSQINIKTLIEAYKQFLGKMGIDIVVASSLIDSMNNALDGDFQDITESENILIDEKMLDENLIIFKKLME